MTNTFPLKILTTVIVNHILFLVGMWYVFSSGDIVWIMYSVIAWTVITLSGIIVNHRFLSHRSFKMSKFWEYTLSTLAVYITYGSSLRWVSMHRMHHANADKVLDPYSPYINRESPSTRKFSNWQATKVWFGFWDVPAIPRQYAADIMRDPYHVFLHRHYFKVLLAPLILMLFINPLLVVFLYSIPAVLHTHVCSTILVVTHKWGYRNHNTSDESTNSWWSALLTFGEGWHNNHHANPGNWTTQYRWWEIDPAGWFIKIIKK